MKSYYFEVRGVNPLPKERARINTNNRRGYTPSRTLAYENEVALIIKSRLNAMGLDTSNFKEPLAIVVHFIRKTRHHADTDNLTKAVKDSLQGIIWENDAMIKGDCAYISYDKKDYGFNLMVMSYHDWLKKLGVESLTDSIRGYD